MTAAAPEVPGLRAEPNDIDAEQAVLGGMIQSPSALSDCLDLLRPADFYRPAHRIIFEAVSRMSDDGVPVDVLTLRGRLEADPGRLKYGGGEYLHTIMQACPVPANAAWYAGKVRDLAARRALDGAAGTIAVIAANPEMDAAERADHAARALDTATARDAGAEALPLGELLPGFLELLDSDTPAPKITSGWVDLERIIPGFGPGELIVIGGRPGMGKTAAMIGLAGHAAVGEKRPVLFHSLEMTRNEILQRLLSAFARVPLAHIRDRKLTDEEWERIGDARGRLAEAPLHISDDPYPRLHDIRSNLRGMRRRGAGAELLCLDYLQLMTGADKPENRQLEVAALARGLKLVAKEFTLPVIAGSQLNRGPEARTDKRPIPADLRESGAVEQDSDVVILLYRDEVYNRESKDAGTIEFHVAKHRNGAPGVATLAFRAPYAQIANAWKWAPGE